MNEYDYQADDEKKVIPLETGDDEYEPEEDDIPFEFRKPNPKEIEYHGKSGEKYEINDPYRLNCPVVDENGSPVANEMYQITLPSGKVIYGETNDKGILEELIFESGEIIIEMEDGSEMTIETE